MDARIVMLGAALAMAPLVPARAAEGAAIGEGQAVAGLASAAGVNASLQWVEVANGGHLAALRIASPGAVALRAGIRIGEVDPSAKLRFYAPDDANPLEVPAADAIAALARNRAAGESGPDARTWWSPVVNGDTLVLEIELPPGADPAALRVAVPLVSRIVERPGRTDGAVAVVTANGVTSECAGTLAVVKGGARPVSYFATASRCVSTQSAASSLQAFWPDAISGVGARLLYASAETGTAFVALDAPPAQAERLASAASMPLDPALEQWLGAAAGRSASQVRTFSFP